MSVLNPDELVFDIECYCFAEFNRIGKVKTKDQYKRNEWQYNCHGLTKNEMRINQNCSTTDEWMTKRKYLSRWNRK